MLKTWYSSLNKLSDSKNFKYIIIAIIIIFLAANKGFRSLIGNFAELQSLQKEHLALQEENKKLKLKLKLMKSDDYMESMARKMGFLNPNETEYRFQPPKNNSEE
ncbi:MAG: septum formation initiator family protein [Elusimicrobiales bacterium]|nr:septum formation initiator family protein [Elusimicrobiales bacterium]